jgi:hypothetical protein
MGRRWRFGIRWEKAAQEFDKRNRFAAAASAMKLSKNYVKSISDAKKNVTDARQK